MLGHDGGHVIGTSATHPFEDGPLPPSWSTDGCAFLNGGGEAARMIRERDWSTHPLGYPQTWPEGLRVALGIVLNSPESMILAWGLLRVH